MEHSAKNSSMTHMHWNRLLLMAGLHFVAMYILMYAMVDQFDNVLPNLNQAYMAVIMTSPMLIIEVLLMGSMYGDRKVLAAIVAGSVLVFTAAFVGIRQQAAIGDKEFLRSMIPHHGAAILMCDQAPIDDAEIIELCQQITSSQQAEIDQMKQILERME